MTRLAAWLRGPLTKAQLGRLLLAIGLGGDAFILLAGRLGAGAWSGIGPVEGAALGAGLLVALVGLSLLPQGARLATAPATLRSLDARMPQPDRRFLHWLSRGLMVIALLAFVAYLVVYLAYAVNLFRWPYDYDQGEGFELYDAVLHSRGEWPYRDSSIFPFYASNYPPVFHLLTMLLFPLVGPRLLAGRLVSFAASLFTAALIGWGVRRRVGGHFIPLVAGLAYLASNFVYHIGPLCRQHITMVLMETLAVLFIAESEDERHGRRNLGLGLLFLLIAGYTKQLSIFTAVAIFGYLFLRHPLRAVGWMSIFSVAFGVIFLLLNVATDGQWWLNTIAANVNEYIFPQLMGLVRSWLRVHLLFILLAVGQTLCELYFGQITLPSLWFLASLGTGLMSGKWGAGEAYWITSVAAAALLSGLALGRLCAWAVSIPRREQLLAILIPLALLAQATRMVHLPTDGPIWGRVARLLGVAGRSVYADYAYFDTVGYTQMGHLLTSADYAGGARIMAHVEAVEGLVFSEEATFTILAGKPVVTNPTQLLNLYNNHLLDTAPLEAMIRREAFDLVILRAQFYPPPILAALGQHYGLVEHIPMNGFQYIILKPLGRPEL